MYRFVGVTVGATLVGIDIVVSVAAAAGAVVLVKPSAFMKLRLIESEPTSSSLLTVSIAFFISRFFVLRLYVST